MYSIFLLYDEIFKGSLLNKAFCRVLKVGRRFPLYFFDAEGGNLPQLHWFEFALL